MAEKHDEAKTYKYVRRSFVVGKKENGQQERVTVRGKTKKEAEAKLEEAKRLHAKGIKGGDLTVSEWSERWKKTYKTNVSKEQRKHYEAKLNHDILPFIGDMQMKSVLAMDLQELLNSHTGGSESTVEKLKQMIQMLFFDASYEGIIERDPSARLEMPEVEIRYCRPLYPEERKILIETSLAHKHGAYALVLLYTGLRRGEALALTRGDIDLKNKSINVNKAINLSQNQPKLSVTKAEKLRKKTRSKEDSSVNRIVPIPDLLLPAITALCDGKENNDILFPKVSGGYASQKASRDWFKSIKRQCHLLAGAETYRNAILVDKSPFDDKITTRHLRRTYATDLLAAGIDPRSRKALMGHKIDDVTDMYTAMSSEAFYRALEQLNLYLNNEKWKEEKKPLLEPKGVQAEEVMENVDNNNLNQGNDSRI